MRNHAILKMAAAGMMAVAMMALGTIRAQGSDTVLKPADMQKLLPASVYYRGQSATTQVRNSGGVKFADGSYLLASLVNTSGYSTAVSSKYQACFITEVPIELGGEKLATGVYGVGFIGDGFHIKARIAGHSSITITQRYCHPQADANEKGIR
ncbi:MAG: hypothetical protein ABSC47_02875 [Terracidiphilus sp.]|jgi:hypothetical protein